MFQVPTDNLYKFCALTGVIVCSAVIYFLWSEYVSISEKINETHLQVKILGLEIQYFGEDVERLRARIEELEKIRTEQEKANETRQEIITKGRKVEMRVVELDHATSYVDALQKRLIVLFVLGVAIFFAGFQICRYGFVNWYKKIQEPQDAQIPKPLADAQSSEGDGDGPQSEEGSSA